MQEFNKTTGGINNAFTKRPRQTLQDLPYCGNALENDSAVLPDGWFTIDIDGHNIRVHDGVKAGGFEVPNLEKVRQMITSGVDSSIFVGTLSAILSSTTTTTGDIGVAIDTHGLLVRDALGKWGGSLGSVSQATLDALTAGELAMLADGATATVAGEVRSYAWGAWAVWPTPGYGMAAASFSPRDHLSGAAKNRIAFWGSSTFALGCSTDCLASGFDSMIFGIQSRMRPGSPVIPVYNGAVSGSTSLQIRDAYLASVDSVAHDISCVQLGGNDLNGQTNTNNAIAYADECVRAALVRGRRIILVVPYARRLGESNVYRAQYAAWCHQIADRLRGLVFVADMFQVITLANGGETPASLLADGTTHINYAGITLALTAFDSAFVAMFGSSVYDPSVLYTSKGIQAIPTITTNCAQAPGPTDGYGRDVKILTPINADLVSYMHDDSALVVGEKYALMGEFEILSFAGTGDAFAGIYVRTTDSTTYHKIGCSGKVYPSVPFDPGYRHRITAEFVAVPGMETVCRRGFMFKRSSIAVYGLSIQRISNA